MYNNAYAFAMSKLEKELNAITLEAQKADLVAKIARLRAEMHVEGIAREIEKNSKVPAISRAIMGHAMTTKR